MVAMGDTDERIVVKGIDVFTSVCDAEEEAMETAGYVVKYVKIS